MSRYRCYPVFLPQAGCPFRCVYCRQPAMVEGPGRDHILDHGLEAIDGLARQAGVQQRPGEIAFYGGTFTLLERPVLEALLDRAAAWVERGRFTGIRFSTRPDALAQSIVSWLQGYPVQTVELGVQSLSERVLRASRRGYGPSAVVEAALRVRRSGWDLGCQLMPGLPGDSRRAFRETVEAVVGLGPQLVRLYPTLVLRATVLERWWRTGRYRPLSLEQAVDWCAAACETFDRAGIAVVRMGLHPDERLRRPGTVRAGPFHPSFGYLVKARGWRCRIESHLRARGAGNNVGRSLLIRVAERRVSEVIGWNRENLRDICKMWQFDKVLVEGEPRWLADEMEMVINDENPLRRPEKAVS